MKNMAILVLCLFSWMTTAKAAIPDNDMSIPPMRVKDFEMITEHEFNSVLQILYRIYAPVIKEKSGLNFVMNADWKDGTVNAFATREPESWTVHINGGIARAKGMTTDSLALIVCHEIGHHLGGAPRTFLYEGWPSAEGQADYWASSKCMKNYYAVLANDEVRIDASVVPEKIITDCSYVYKNLSDLKICVRSQMANLDFARFLNSLPDAKTAVTLESKDDRIVKGTNTNDYPRAQCRFDTVYQGALCDIGSHVATSETDAKIGHCNDTTKPGTRPRCWYKPKD